MTPPQKRGRSKQDYQTPPEFLSAVLGLLGVDSFAIDLASSDQNAVCPWHYTLEHDSLSMSWRAWSDGAWAWCNPPFSHIEPWVKKAYESHSPIAMLLPAGVGSNWFRDWVFKKAYVLLLNGRITFVGQEDAYPKDCILILWGMPPDIDIWTWAP